VLHFPVTLWGTALVRETRFPWPLEFLALSAATLLLSWWGFLLLERLGPLGWAFGCRWRARAPL